jgi:hypothetical protein
VPTQRGPDLHRDKLGLADDADRQALRELRIVAPVALIVALVTGSRAPGLRPSSRRDVRLRVPEVARRVRQAQGSPSEAGVVAALPD